MGHFEVGGWKAKNWCYIESAVWRAWFNEHTTPLYRYTQAGWKLFFLPWLGCFDPTQFWHKRESHCLEDREGRVSVKSQYSLINLFSHTIFFDWEPTLNAMGAWPVRLEFFLYNTTVVTFSESSKWSIIQFTKETSDSCLLTYKKIQAHSSLFEVFAS